MTTTNMYSGMNEDGKPSSKYKLDLFLTSLNCYVHLSSGFFSSLTNLAQAIRLQTLLPG